MRGNTYDVVVVLFCESAVDPATKRRNVNGAGQAARTGASHPSASLSASVGRRRDEHAETSSRCLAAPSRCLATLDEDGARRVAGSTTAAAAAYSRHV